MIICDSRDRKECSAYMCVCVRGNCGMHTVYCAGEGVVVHKCMWGRDVVCMCVSSIA